MAFWFWIIVIIIALILFISVFGVVLAVSGGVIGFFAVKLLIESLYQKEMNKCNDKLLTFDAGMQSLFRLSEYLKKYKKKHIDCCNENELLNVTKSVKDRELAELISYIHSVGCELVFRPVTAELSDTPEMNDSFLEDKNSIVVSLDNKAIQEIEDTVCSNKYENNPFVLRQINSYQNYNLYRDFQKSCEEYGVSVNSYTNLYNLLLSLRRKNLHFELSKDGYVEYNLSAENNLFSREKAVRFEKIIFSQDISSEELMLCLRYVFSIHGLYTIEHPKYRDLVNFSDWKTQFPYMHSEYEKNRLLQYHNSYIFLGLFLMRYRLTISDKEYCNEDRVKDLKSLKQYIDREEFKADSDDLHSQEVKLSKVCEIIKEERTNDSYISKEKDYLPIIFSEDILTNNPRLKYYTSQYTDEKNLVVNDDIILNASDFSIISLWKGGLCHPSNEIVLIKGTSTDLLQEYLCIYLDSIFNYCYSLGLSNIENVYLLRDLTVLIPSKQNQRYIIEKVKENPDFDPLSYLEELYPNFSSIIENIEKLYSNKTSLSSTSSLTTSYYSGYGTTYVRGYRRKDGVYVRGHSRRR